MIITQCLVFPNSDDIKIFPSSAIFQILFHNSNIFKPFDIEFTDKSWILRGRLQLTDIQAEAVNFAANPLQKRVLTIFNR